MEGLQCLPYGQGSTFWSQVYFYTEMCTSFIFPFIYLLSINSVIIHTLRNRRKSLKVEQYQGQGQSGGQTRRTKVTEAQITVTLLAVTFSFLTLTTPGYVMMMYSVLIGVGTTPKGVATFFFLFQVGKKAYYTNYAINFFLYVTSGKNFRTDLEILFLCVREKTSNNPVS